MSSGVYKQSSREAGGGGGGAGGGFFFFFNNLRGFGENVRAFTSRLRFFFFFFRSGDRLAHANFTLYARISPQWLSKLRRLWPTVP